MQTEYIYTSGRQYEGGNEVLRYRIEVPHIDGLELINDFYATVMRECEIYCKQRLIASVSHLKGGRSEKYTYKLDCVLTHLDDRVACVLVLVSLAENGKEIYRYVYPNNWSVEDAMLMPPKSLIKLYGKKGERFVSGERLFVNEGDLESVDKVNVNSLLLKNKGKNVSKTRMAQVIDD